tara:strand:+ start:271 stop:1212 length:942 start_codon:yes stop_codon:yes gene_type:complete
MTKNKRRSFELFNLSFLDIISCGFGAIVILLLISKTGVENNNLNQVEDEVKILIELQEKNKSLVERKKTLDSQLVFLTSSENQLENEIKSIEKAIEKLSNEKRNSVDSNSEFSKKLKNIKNALQNSNDNNERDIEVGGIPVDSEYIVFIIDTSGSMQRIWKKVMMYVEEIIKIHPTVKGFKIINDQGVPMGANDTYLIDTETFRAGAIAQLKNFSGQSSSNPVRGIISSLRKIKTNERTSFYVIGDDYSMIGSREFSKDLKNIRDLNTTISGKRKARIHGIGFISSEGSGLEFSKFMRALTQENDGTFIALPD